MKKAYAWRERAREPHTIKSFAEEWLSYFHDFLPALDRTNPLCCFYGAEMVANFYAQARTRSITLMAYDPDDALPAATPLQQKYTNPFAAAHAIKDIIEDAITYFQKEIAAVDAGQFVVSRVRYKELNNLVLYVEELRASENWHPAQPDEVAAPKQGNAVDASVAHPDPPFTTQPQQHAELRSREEYGSSGQEAQTLSGWELAASRGVSTLEENSMYTTTALQPFAPVVQSDQESTPAEGNATLRATSEMRPDEEMANDYEGSKLCEGLSTSVTSHKPRKLAQQGAAQYAKRAGSAEEQTGPANESKSSETSSTLAAPEGSATESPEPRTTSRRPRHGWGWQVRKETARSHWQGSNVDISHISEGKRSRKPSARELERRRDSHH